MVVLEVFLVDEITLGVTDGSITSCEYSNLELSLPLQHRIQ